MDMLRQDVGGKVIEECKAPSPQAKFLQTGIKVKGENDIFKWFDQFQFLLVIVSLGLIMMTGRIERTSSTREEGGQMIDG